MTFQNQVVLITGASNGIGRCLAIDLAARGAVVIGCGRSAERLQTISAELQRASPLSAAVQCDVSKLDQVREMVAAVLGKFGKIDILINNAGIGMRKPFAETPIGVIEELIKTNYLGAVYCTHEALPSMIARGNGHIVNISSAGGIIGAPNIAGYCASKFAMNGLSEGLYHELAPCGINVSVICPGPVRTDFNKSFADTPPKSPASLVVSPEFVSAAVIKAIEKKRFEAVLPPSLALICWVKRMAPNLFRAVARRSFRHIVKGKKT
ncbi:MAG TPA: SDR family oxidoreductase [Candidatus Binatia bacterium]